MSLSEKQMKHERFMDMSSAINDAINMLADQFDIGITEIDMHKSSLDKIADDMARVLMKMWNVNHS